MRMVYWESALLGPQYTNGYNDSRRAGIPMKTLRAGRPKLSCLRSDVQLIERILDEDRLATVRELEERSGIPNQAFIALFKMNWKRHEWLIGGSQNFYQRNKSKNG